MADVVDGLVGIAPGSPLDAIRGHRAIARAQTEESFRVLFAPAEWGDVPAAERFAVARFVAGLHGQPDVAAVYAGKLAESGAPPALIVALDAEQAAAAAHGPYGRFPAGKLSAEDQPGPSYRAADPAALGRRIAAALAHAHMLVFHPRDAAQAHLQALLDAGWSTDGIVTLSQIVAFVSYQVRVVAGLSVLKTRL